MGLKKVRAGVYVHRWHGMGELTYIRLYDNLCCALHYLPLILDPHFCKCQLSLMGVIWDQSGALHGQSNSLPMLQLSVSHQDCWFRSFGEDRVCGTRGMRRLGSENEPLRSTAVLNSDELRPCWWENSSVKGKLHRCLARVGKSGLRLNEWGGLTNVDDTNRESIRLASFISFICILQTSPAPQIAFWLDLGGN